MPTRPPRIFVADDQRDVVESLRLLLKGEGYAAETFEHPTALINALGARTADAVLMDLNYTRDTTSGDEGLDAIARIRTFDAHTPLVVMTAWGSIGLAVEAMRRGAQDFIEKPWDNERLLSVLRTQVALGQALNRARVLEAENKELSGGGGGELIAESSSMRPVLETIEQVAPTDANVLITGESGCGKGLVARMIHEQSGRRERSFVTVNIGSLAETVFESEMFGHVKGAFTDAKADRVGRFELADGGTLFLDEIANIPIAQQARLLRVLEGGEFERLGSSRTQQVDVRVLAATNADLSAEIAGGKFRGDLLYRLNTIHIQLPPLRERGDDIVRLAQAFLARHAARHRKPARAFTDPALSALRRFAWPGNVRELSHVVERAVLMTAGDSIGPADLRLTGGASARGGNGASGQPMTLDAIEQEAIRAALARHDGNVVAAAEELGVSRSALYRRMEKLGL
jgi:DNA-binding NtrC family response regulator